METWEGGKVENVGLGKVGTWDLGKWEGWEVGRLGLGNVGKLATCILFTFAPVYRLQLVCVIKMDGA